MPSHPSVRSETAADLARSAHADAQQTTRHAAHSVLRLLRAVRVSLSDPAAATEPSQDSISHFWDLIGRAASAATFAWSASASAARVATALTGPSAPSAPEGALQELRLLGRRTRVFLELAAENNTHSRSAARHLDTPFSSGGLPDRAITAPLKELLRDYDPYDVAAAFGVALEDRGMETDNADINLLGFELRRGVDAALAGEL